MVEIPSDYAARVVLVEQCLARLTVQQRTFLAAIRDARFNVRRAVRAHPGLSSTRAHSQWMHDANYATVFRIWQANVAADAGDRARLLARHDDIVETALTPKPVLHQGIAVIHDGKVLEEVDGATALRGNEALMRAAGMFPKEGAEVGVAVQLPSISVELTTRKAQVVDAEVVEVDPAVKP